MSGAGRGRQGGGGGEERERETGGREGDRGREGERDERYYIVSTKECNSL